MKRIVVKSDFPLVEELREINEEISLEDLKKTLASTAGIEERTFEEYTVYAISFGKDVIHILPSNPNDVKNIGQCIPNNSTVYLVAPAGIKPLKKFQRKKKEQEEVKKEKTEIQTEEDLKFRGITEENCLAWLLAAKRREETDRYSLVLEFIDTMISKLLKTSKFLKLPKNIILDIVSRNSLIVDEFKLFKAIVAWAENRAKRINQLHQTEKNVKENTAKKKIPPQKLSKIIKPLLKFVRFPLMHAKDIISYIRPLGFLSSDEIRDLFAYTVLQREIDTAKMDDDFNNKLYKKQVKYSELLKNKDTLKEFQFNSRDGKFVIVWLHQNDFEYQIFETSFEARKKFKMFSTKVNRILILQHTIVESCCSSKDWEKKIDSIF